MKPPLAESCSDSRLVVTVWPDFVQLLAPGLWNVAIIASRTSAPESGSLGVPNGDGDW